MRPTDLKKMSVSDLLTLRRNVDEMLSARRSELELQLSQMSGGKTKSGKSGPRKQSGKVEPKFRHPKTGETWSGRGATVGWLAAEIKNGKTKDDFLIKASGKRAYVKHSKKSEK